MKSIKRFENFNKNNFLFENELPPFLGTNYNEVHILYQLSQDSFSYVPASVRHWAINTDGTLFNRLVSFQKNEEEKYKSSLLNKEFFFIYYREKIYIYFPAYKKLWDKSQNVVNSSEKDANFKYDITEIIKNTLKLEEF